MNTVNGYKADIEYNQALLDKTLLKAPFDGYIGLRQVSVGAYVSPTTLIATLLQLDKIKIDFPIPEDYSSVLKVGATVDVEMDETGKTQKSPDYRNGTAGESVDEKYDRTGHPGKQQGQSRQFCESDMCIPDWIKRPL